jgi:hypothetical protein
LNLQTDLEPVCKTAVRNFCISKSDGPDLCLRDYLIPDWKPSVKVESYAQITDVICDVILESDRCDQIAYQPNIGDERQELFVRNYETIKVPLPDDFPRHLRSGELLKHQKKHEISPNQVEFKTHVYCRKPRPVFNL